MPEDRRKQRVGQRGEKSALLPHGSTVEEKPIMPSSAKAQSGSMEGIAVVGEAVRRVTADTAEFLIEISTVAPTAAQALRDQHAKMAQIAHALAPLGAQRTDVQTVSMNVVNTFTPMIPALPPYGAPPQIGPGAFGLQPEIQFGTYQARCLQRVTVRDTNRTGEIVDALTKAGATVVGGFSYRAADEPAARCAALEAAARDARAKAEALAKAAGSEVGDAIAIFEDVIASNGAYSAMRAQAPWMFGPAAPALVGELEYYARVTANFRLGPSAGRIAGETR
jgi:uncharacterized protein YggE